MAKRARGSHPTRPAPAAPAHGRRGPRPTPSADDADRRDRPTLTPQEEARAAELEAQIVAEEQAADDARDAGRRSAAVARRRSRRRARPSPVSAAEEYAYVGARRPPDHPDRRLADRVPASCSAIVTHLSGAGPI